MSARGKRWKEARAKRDGGGFVAIPLTVLDSAAYLGAGAHAKALLLDLLSQYRGNNNGDLTACWRFMKERGWKSQDTLNRAKKALIECGLIVETRMGARPNKASLYAITWLALDECGGKLDIRAQDYPRGRYRLYEPHPLQALKTKR